MFGIPPPLIIGGAVITVIICVLGLVFACCAGVTAARADEHAARAFQEYLANKGKA